MVATALPALTNPIQRHRFQRAATSTSKVDRAWLYPESILRTPDAWQIKAVQQAVTRMEPVLLCCSRQVGKTEVTAASSYITAAAGGFVLVLTPSDDQSMEFMARVMEFHHEHHLVNTRSEPTRHELLLEGGGRILARPNNERTVRVYSKVELLIIDEASRVPDALYGAVSPMLAVSKGRTMLLSTPFGKRGFFYKEWSKQGKKDWRRHCVPWWDCPRIPIEHVEAERTTHGDTWVSQEYECEFNSTVNSPFDIDAMMSLERSEYPVILS